MDPQWQSASATRVLMPDRNPVSFVDLLEHQSLPELADALARQLDHIIIRWEESVRQILPDADKLTLAQLMDDAPEALCQLADALTSTDPKEARLLAEESARHAAARFQHQFNLKELVIEYRLLRRIIVEELHAALHRNMTPMEQVALHMGIDAMLQRAILAFVEYQQDQLRASTDVQAKYLSFISHDLRNNLNSMTLTLELLKRRLTGVPGMEEEVADLNSLQQSVLTTVTSMSRLLDAERLRHQAQARIAPVDLQALVAKVLQQYSAQARQKNLQLASDVPPDATVNSDKEWIRLVLQNLVGNAIKYTAQGTIRIQAQPRPTADGWILSVSDQGPGIAPEQAQRLFQAFQRGNTHGQPGMGLGLAIASEAAKQLGGQLTVESQLGAGSTFRLILPQLPQ